LIRFFAEAADISSGLILLNADDTAHMRSLRLRPTELFVVCDGKGFDHICHLATRDGGTAAEIVETRPSIGEPSIACSVYIAFAKGERLDYAVQKSVELGASEVILFPAKRCVSVPYDMTSKTLRLKRIAYETAKQCGRGCVPNVTVVRSFEIAIKQAKRAELPLFLYEEEEKLSLKQALESGAGGAGGAVGVVGAGGAGGAVGVVGGGGAVGVVGAGGAGGAVGVVGADAAVSAGGAVGAVGFSTISIVSGPEGGFEPKEAEYARSEGMLAVTLGPRILRCETAPVAALAAIMFHTGNL